MDLFEFVVSIVEQSYEAAKRISQQHFEKNSFGSDLEETNSEVFAVAEQLITAYVTLYCHIEAHTEPANDQ